MVKYGVFWQSISAMQMDKVTTIIDKQILGYLKSCVVKKILERYT